MHPPTHTRHSTISLGLQANRKLGELQELGHELAVELAGTRRQHAGQTQTLDTLRESVAAALEDHDSRMAGEWARESTAHAELHRRDQLEKERLRSDNTELKKLLVATATSLGDHVQ